MQNKITVYQATELIYRMGDGEKPFLRLPHAYSNAYNIDTFPCYSHDIKTVKRLFRECKQAFPLGRPLNVYVSGYEADGRWNGYHKSHYDWNGEGKPRTYSHQIVLSGKRTPIHPAMTRFVVPHEYGHGVEKFITSERGEEHWDKFREEYETLRKGTYATGYVARQWHSTVGEMIADDFRILVMSAELEHWPHPGFARPEASPKVVKAWKRFMAGEYKDFA